MDKKLFGAAVLSAGVGLTALSAPIVVKSTANAVPSRPKLEARVTTLESELEVTKNYEADLDNEITLLRSDLSDAVKRIEELENPDSDSPPSD